jgi:hypothetical protein
MVFSIWSVQTGSKEAVGWRSSLEWIRCSKGTSIIKKPNPSLFIKGGTTKEKKHKSWHWTNIWPWVPAGIDAKSDRASWLPAVSYCSALLCPCWDTRRQSTRVEAGSNTSTVTLRVVGGDENGSLKSETVKYGRESQGTRTRERLRWQGPGACTKDRPILSSERAPHKSKTVTVKQ